MNKLSKNILSIFIGVLLINGLMIWYRLSNDNVFTIQEMLAYPLIFGTGFILILLALNKYLLKESFSIFNSGQGRWYTDVFIGLFLTSLYFLFILIERLTIKPFLPQTDPPSKEIINLMIGLAKNPVLLSIWLGPVVWIGVALFEEIQRIFFLNCLWKISGNKKWEVFSIILVSVMWGVMHFYQGAFGIISITLQGMIMGFYFYRYRRFLPLLISHALYDSIQIIIFVIQVN